MCEGLNSGSCLLKDGFDGYANATPRLLELGEVTTGDPDQEAVLMCLNCAANLVGIKTEKGVTTRAVVIPMRVLPEGLLAAHPDRMSA